MNAPKFLLDANVLIALSTPSHPKNELASEWLGSGVPFAICPTVEGAVCRFLVRIGERPDVARSLLQSIRALPQCHPVPDDALYAEMSWDGITGHRQLTDAHLADLAERHGMRLATFDKGIARLRPDSTVLLA